MYVTLFRSEAAAATRTNLTALILRLSLAAIFLFHGVDKIVRGSGGGAWVTEMYGRIPTLYESKAEREGELHKQPPESLTFAGTQLAVAWGEFLGGLALAIGLLTRLAAVGQIIIQAGAVVLVTAPRGFSHLGGGGYEYNLLLIAVCLAVIVLGPGRWSIDWMLVQRRAKYAHRTPAAAPLPVSQPHTVPSEATGQAVPGARS